MIVQNKRVVATGNNLNASTDTGAPVKIGGRANAGLPAAVGENQRVNTSHTTRGQARVKLDENVIVTMPTAFVTAVFTVATDTLNLDLTAFPNILGGARTFGLQVIDNGVVSWDLRLMATLQPGSFVGNNTEIAAHTNLTGSGVTVFAVDKPARALRVRAAGLVSGGSNITVNLFAMF